MSTVLQCQLCRHYWGQGRCDAFPEAVPHEIIRGEHDHREPYKGDNGIRFEPVAKPKGGA